MSNVHVSHVVGHVAALVGGALLDTISGFII